MTGGRIALALRTPPSMRVHTGAMKPLQPPDSFHLLTAQGCVELGNHVEANAELEKIAPQSRAVSEVVTNDFVAKSQPNLLRLTLRAGGSYITRHGFNLIKEEEFLPSPARPFTLALPRHRRIVGLAAPSRPPRPKRKALMVLPSSWSLKSSTFIAGTTARVGIDLDAKCANFKGYHEQTKCTRGMVAPGPACGGYSDRHKPACAETSSWLYPN
jgi:hypothetical protein